MSSGGGNRVSGDGGAAHTSVNRDFNNATLNRSNTTTTSNLSSARSATANRNVNVSNGEISANRGNVNTGNINRGNVNTGNINRGNINTGNVNNVNVNGYGGNYHLDYDVDNGWHHPIAAGAVFGAAAAVTSAAIGSVVYSLPPSCTVTVVNGISYQNCGGVWYEPQFAGTSVEYVVVESPK